VAAAASGRVDWLLLLAGPLIGLALGAAGYSAFLFAQAEGRDFWQSSLLLPHLLVAALAAGAAVGLLTHGASPVLRGLLLLALGAHLVLVLAERWVSHPNLDGTAGARWLAEGPGRIPLWAGVVTAGTLLPLALVLLSPAWPAGALASVLALAGLYLWEDLWLRAGQSVPLS
jgi:hypothetical protein